MDTLKSKSPASAQHQAINSQARSIQARELFGLGTVVFIEHQGERYQLRQTRNGKLILTK